MNTTNLKRVKGIVAMAERTFLANGSDKLILLRISNLSQKYAVWAFGGAFLRSATVIVVTLSDFDQEHANLSTAKSLDYPVLKVVKLLSGNSCGR